MNLILKDEEFKIFDELFKKRPEIIPETLKVDLERYYLPFINKLVTLKEEKKISARPIIGISAIQGAGKTTQEEVIKILLNHFDFSTAYLSIDDHYITHQELLELQKKDPRYIRRGVTHDISLALSEFKTLQEMDGVRPYLIAGYDKGAHHGAGDRFKFIVPLNGLTQIFKVEAGSLSLQSATFNGQSLSFPENMGATIPLDENIFPEEVTAFLKSTSEGVTLSCYSDAIEFSNSSSKITLTQKDLPNGWHLVIKAPDFIFYDGWMLGARRVSDESIFESGLPALDTPEHIQFAKDINRKLSEYEELWSKIEFLNLLYISDYQLSLNWRDQAEDVLRAKGEGMTHGEVQDFVHYFWRSVHPAIQIKNLAHDTLHTQQVVVINDHHGIERVSRPEELVD